MTAPVFVDTNVLVYRHDSSDPAKQSRANDWITLLASRRSARISFQVLQELYVTLTRKLKPDYDTREAQDIVRDLAVWRPVTVDLAAMERSWHLQQRYSLSWWGSLIVAAAQSCECSVLLTEDLQHGQIIDGIRVIDPFKSPDRMPAEVLETLER
ncbi:MAG: PIN domain-containing protein [Bryobacterales bacterium]|nr:PIN domain-containing protein [Bryobacterales bacterium]